MTLSGSDGRARLVRARWAAIGAAIAVSIGGGGLFVANAASSPASSVVTIDPVRVLDTRTDVGLPGPFVSPVSQKLQVTGAAVPAGATGVLLNATVVGPTANGFLSIRPGDATGAPSTSSLNFKAGDVIPNSVQVGLPTSGANAGKIDITYDALGIAGPTTEVLIDVVGYLVAGGTGTGTAGTPGATGAAGAAGSPGRNGDKGEPGRSAWDEIPSGRTVTGSLVWDGPRSTVTGSDSLSVDLPGVAPVDLDVDTVNFAPSVDPAVGDEDTACGGSVAKPAAPAGKVCLYLSSSGGLDADSLNAGQGLLPKRTFQVDWDPIAGSPDAEVFWYATWAYTAP